jgi:hypothetical protein
VHSRALQGSTLRAALRKGFGCRLEPSPGERRARDTPFTPTADVLHTACILMVSAGMDTGCRSGQAKVACAACWAARNQRRLYPGDIMGKQGWYHFQGICGVMLQCTASCIRRLASSSKQCAASGVQVSPAAGITGALTVVKRLRWDVRCFTYASRTIADTLRVDHQVRRVHSVKLEFR